MNVFFYKMHCLMCTNFVAKDLLGKALSSLF